MANKYQNDYYTILDLLKCGKDNFESLTEEQLKEIDRILFEIEEQSANDFNDLLDMNGIEEILDDVEVVKNDFYEKYDLSDEKCKGLFSTVRLLRFLINEFKIDQLGLFDKKPEKVMMLHNAVNVEVKKDWTILEVVLPTSSFEIKIQKASDNEIKDIVRGVSLMDLEGKEVTPSDIIDICDVINTKNEKTELEEKNEDIEKKANIENEYEKHFNDDIDGANE